MNELIKNEQYTSLKVAELTGKQHKNVMQDIKDEISKIGVENGGLIFQLVKYTDKKGELRPMYNLTKNGWIQIGARYDAKVRFTMIQYIDKLESGKLPENYIEALEAHIKQVKLNEAQHQIITGLEQALDVSEQWVSIIRYAKDNGIKENTLNWRVLKAYSKANGIEVKKTTCPRFGYKLLYHISVFEKCYPKNIN